jgi:formate transporter
MSDDETTPRVEARKPPEIADQISDMGETKARTGTARLVTLGTLAGVYIGFGGMFATVAAAGAEGLMPHGATRVLAGIVFSLGLVLVIAGGAELFTGNTLKVVTLAEERIGVPRLLRTWAIVWAANLVGSLILVALALGAGFHAGGDGSVAAAAVETAAAKASMPFVTVIASGILANMLVCLAVWLAAGSRSMTDTIMAIILPIAAFVAMDLEHSVANMFLIPYGLAVREFTDPSAWMGTGAEGLLELGVLTTLRNISAATLGNIIGGAALGLAYWFVYLRDDNSQKRPA